MSTSAASSARIPASRAAASSRSADQNEPGAWFVASPSIPESVIPEERDPGHPEDLGRPVDLGGPPFGERLAGVEDPVGDLAELAPGRHDEHDPVPRPRPGPSPLQS